MGLGNLFRKLRSDQRAMPDPDSPEFQQAVEGSALPGSAQMGQAGWASVGDTASAPEMPDVVPGMPGSMPGTPSDQAAFFGPGSGQPGAVTPESLIAAGVPPEHAQAAAAAYAQAQQMFGGASMNAGDISVENQGSQTLDLRGMEGVRDEMREVMRQHGVDPDSGVAMDASSVPGLQEALLKVLAQHGVDPTQYGR